MPWKQIEIDESILRFGEGIVRVAEGDYLSEIARVTVSPADLNYEEVDPFLEFHCKLIEGPDGLGKVLRRRVWVAAAKDDGSGGSWGLGQVLDALGADPSSLVKMKFPTYEHFAKFGAGLNAKLSGQKVGLEVADDTYSSSRSNQTVLVSRITRLFKAEEWALRSKPRTTPSPAPTAAPKALASNGASNGAAPTPVSVASPAEVVEESSLEDDIKKLFATTA